MKILQVNKLYSPWIGGIEKIVQQISEGLNGKNNFKIEILCCSPKGKGGTEKVNEIKVHRSSSFGIFWGMPVSFNFLKLFKKLRNNYDTIDLHHPFPLGNLAILLFRPKGKLLIHYHSDIVRQKILEPLVKPLILTTLKKADKILVSNPNLIKNSPYLKKFKKKCEVIPFGTYLQEIKNALDEKIVQEIKNEYGKFILFVGRLNYYKGVKYLIRAMKKIDANLVIIGEGEEKEKLKKEIQKLRIENKIFFLSHQPRKELINFYQACQVFVLPSIFKSEAFGIVLIEAMACGKPIISTELGTGTSWININDQTGFVIPPRNSQSLAQALQKILTNKDLSRKFSQKARCRAEEEFSLVKFLKKTSQIYHSQKNSDGYN